MPMTEKDREVITRAVEKLGARISVIPDVEQFLKDKRLEKEEK